MTDTNKLFQTPALTLPLPPWGADADLRRVMDILNDGLDVPPCTLLVGGCVRNAIMGMTGGDYDLATRLLPTDVMNRCLTADLKVVPTGIDHGTVTAVAGGRGFEVTTLRHDIETDGRHAVVGFTDDWVTDAQRRDFTMNTLLADMNGHIYDPLGTGIIDARAGSVLFVGNPAERIAEDYLRILRFFRFHALYGRGEMDGHAVAACALAAPHIATLSVERITTEIMKWIMADNPVPSLKIALENNILNGFVYAYPDFDVLSRVILHQNALRAPDPLARLFVLWDGNVASLTTALRLSNKQINILNDILNVKYNGDFRVQNLRQMIYRHGRAAATARYVIDLATADQYPPETAANIIHDWQPPALPVTGADLIAAGIAPGPEMGARLKRAETAWVESDFALSAEKLKIISLR